MRPAAVTRKRMDFDVDRTRPRRVSARKVSRYWPGVNRRPATLPFQRNRFLPRTARPSGTRPRGLIFGTERPSSRRVPVTRATTIPIDEELAPPVLPGLGRGLAAPTIGCSVSWERFPAESDARQKLVTQLTATALGTVAVASEMPPH